MKTIKGMLKGIIVTAVLAITAAGVAFADDYELTWMDANGDGVSEAYYYNDEGNFSLAYDSVNGTGDLAIYLGDGMESTGCVSTNTDQINGRKDIVNFARQYVGAGVLRYGTGNTLSGPADCSGFVQAVFREFGMSLPRTSREQAMSAPKYVSEAEMMPGDLIFYGGSIGSVSHVAIYTGDHSIVHATNSRRGWVFEDSGTRAMHYTHIAAIGRYW